MKVDCGPLWLDPGKPYPPGGVTGAGAEIGGATAFGSVEEIGPGAVEGESPGTVGEREEGRDGAGVGESTPGELSEGAHDEQPDGANVLGAAAPHGAQPTGAHTGAGAEHTTRYVVYGTIIVCCAIAVIGR